MSLPSEEERFSKNASDLTGFLYVVVDGAYKKGHKVVNPELIQFVSCIMQGFPKKDLIEGFAKHSNKHWELIRNKDRSFFIDHAHTVFADLPVSSVNSFKQLFTLTDDKNCSIISKDDVESLWGFFFSLVKITIKYIHKKRSPIKIINSDNSVTHKYLVDFMNEIDLSKAPEKWKIDLDFPLRH